MSKGFVIAIDGPVASGKGTLAESLAKELNGFHLYTGAMYRCVALLCIERGLDLKNTTEVESVLPDLSIRFEDFKIFLNGTDITERIKQPDTASGASVVGVLPKIRESMVIKQLELAEEAIGKGQTVIAEGRDIGTTVFPEASLKVYLTARPEIRARRRMEQYGKFDESDLRRELENLKTRDSRDMKRSISPLSDNPEERGYFILDNSDINEKETITAVKTELRKRNLII